MNIFDKDLSVHERALAFRGQRMELLSSNLANADTPHFKARDIDFRAVMNKVQGDSALTATRARHYDHGLGLNEAASAVQYRVPFNTAFDGNTVELSVEQAKFGKASADFQASLTFLENRVSSIRRAIKGE